MRPYRMLPRLLGAGYLQVLPVRRRSQLQKWSRATSEEQWSLQFGTVTFCTLGHRAGQSLSLPSYVPVPRKKKLPFPPSFPPSLLPPRRARREINDSSLLRISAEFLISRGENAERSERDWETRSGNPRLASRATPGHVRRRRRRGRLTAAARSGTAFPSAKEGKEKAGEG